MTPTPLVLLTGLAMSGKTTMASALATATDLERRAMPAQTQSEVDSTDASRRRARSGHETNPGRPDRLDEDRMSGLTPLAGIDQASRPAVIESVSVPLLLFPNNPALIIRLSATMPVRITRLRAVHPELTPNEARAILQRKDHATLVATRQAWGVDPEAVGAGDWRADLAVQCPERTLCSDPGVCTAITVDLIVTAYEVYRQYLASASATTLTVRRFRELIDANPERVRRCAPLLSDPLAESAVASGVSRWRDRLLTELEQPSEAEISRRDHHRRCGKAVRQRTTF